MRALNLIVVTSLVSVAACGSNNTATKEESLQIFAAASAAMSSAQSRALSDAQQLRAVGAPAELTIDFSGPCTLGGRVGMTGSVETSDAADLVAVDLKATFDGCREPQGTLDGDLRTTSTVNGTNISVTLKGDIDWEDGNGASASCEFDMKTAVTSETVVVSGHLCGFDVAADLGLSIDRPN